VDGAPIVQFPLVMLLALGTEIFQGFATTACMAFIGENKFNSKLVMKSGIFFYIVRGKILFFEDQGI
jgi:hypothetical protein